MDDMKNNFNHFATIFWDIQTTTEYVQFLNEWIEVSRKYVLLKEGKEIAGFRVKKTLV